MRNWIWIVALLIAAACTTNRKPQEAEVGAVPAVCFDNWDRLGDRLGYFKELIDLQDSAISGQKISIRHLQALMPQDEVAFHIFMATEHYAVIEKDGDLQESPQALYLTAGKMAVADTLDMMEQYLKWFEWSDGWVGETVWSTAVEIERRHPEKFRELMKSSEWYEPWQEFRDGTLEYEKESEK